MRNLDKIKKLTSHPLEDVLGIESNSTEVIRYERNTELKDYEAYDEKEKELEAHYQEVADLALSKFKQLEEIAEKADTKLVARLTEVQFQGLNTALSALDKRTRLKETKDKAIARDKALQTKGNGGNTNIIAIMDRNAMLANLIQAATSPDSNFDIIEGEFETKE